MWNNVSNSFLLQQCRQRRYTFITVVSLAVILIAFFITFASLSGSKPLATLRQINVVFRHGDRTPTYSYPNDPHKDFVWQDGKGALTAKGKFELFSLGEIMKSKYGHFLGPIYRPEEVQMTSSYAPRAQMSAMTFLAGLFPPTGFQIWNQNLLWQPIPVNPIPRKMDNLVAAKAYCARFESEKKQSDAEIEKNLSNAEKELLKFLTEKTGDQISNISKAESLYYTLQIQITRHGSRSPTSTFPTDPYPFTDLKYWPDGPGQLTRLGKQQLYRTGRLLRHRYNGFLNINYFSNDTEVRSNPYDRDYMSAACLLAGLYPPTGYQIWSKRIAWQPIPIWEDRFDVAEIATKPNICPRFSQEQAKSLDRINQNSSEYSDLFKYLSKHTGEKVNSITRIPRIWDTLQIQDENGYKLPSWTKKVFPDQLRPLEGVAFQAYVYGTDDQIKLVAGPILEMILDQLNTKAKGQMRPNRKLYINAAHDITLRALLDGLGIHEAFPIDTSAFMVFELHENSAGYSVRVMYFNNSATRCPRVLDIPACKNPCTLSGFNSAVQKNIPKNWSEECHNTTNDNTR